MADNETVSKIVSTNRITDLLTVVSISLGTVLAVAGLFLVISNFLIINPANELQSTASISNILDLFPGMLFSMSWPFDLVTQGMITVGIINFILGIDILLIGLGLWVRHKYAKWIAITLFGIATCFDFIQFLFFGLNGSPKSVFGFLINGLIVYLLLKMPPEV